MTSPSQTYGRSLLIGFAGFAIAGVAGSLATYLIFVSGIVDWLLAMLPEGQALVRLLLGVMLVFICMGLGGAVGGLVRGWVLHLVDREGSRRRYLLGSAFAFGVTQGVLAVPILLLIGFMSL